MAVVLNKAGAAVFSIVAPVSIKLQLLNMRYGNRFS